MCLLSTSGKVLSSQARCSLTHGEDYRKNMAPRLKKWLNIFNHKLALPHKMEIWSIGMYIGESPFRFSPLESVSNPVLTHRHVTDIPAVFVADPFMLYVNRSWYMFFEVMNRQTGKGEVGLATSKNGVEWTYQQIVLTEPFHLSYPYIFEWMDDYYMIPESYQAGEIRLYKASRFPTQWSFFKTLLRGQYFVDASVFRYNNRWWLYTDTSADMKHNTLSLYHADELTGPWFEHPKSPIIRGNARAARPAGRVIVLNDRVIRYAQDCSPAYGTQVLAFEVTELTIRVYHERVAAVNPILTASRTGWNASGSHHIDPHATGDGQWIACMDGFYWGKYLAYPPLRPMISGKPSDYTF